MINSYFPTGVSSEQDLYEDLIIESIQIYGQDVYYLPRELIDLDTLFYEDVQSKFSSHYQIEMFIPNDDGWEGDGELFAKFGIEIRDEVTFTVPKKRWNDESIQTNANNRPAEGDLIYLPLSKSFFEITDVQTESRFYQLKDLPIFTLKCVLFEYHNNEFDTGNDEIDDFITTISKQMYLELSDETGISEHDMINQGDVNGTILSIDGNIIQVGQISGGFFEIGSATIEKIDNTTINVNIDQIDEKMIRHDQRNSFNEKANEFTDFSEQDPFGDL